jgi:DNA mismatch repair protein MutS
MSETNYTPMMKQYIETKKKYPEGILLFRAGDFYEMFYDDAKTASNILNITLTKRGKGITQAPLAGIPYHSIDPYISKLIQAGKKVVICEQIEDPRFAKGLVKRAVTRIITPSTFFNDTYDNNYLCSISFYKDKYGFSLVDITTGDFKITEFNSFNFLLNELILTKPKELLLTKNILNNLSCIEDIKKTIPNTVINYTDNLDISFSFEKLLLHFNLKSLNIFGILDINHKPEVVLSAYNAIKYLKETQFSNLEYVNNIKEYSLNKYLKLDRKTVRNLELIYNLQDNSKKHSLFNLINKTKTPLGYRKLYFDLLHPILDKNKLNDIYDSVEEIINNRHILQELSLQLSYVGDLEKIISKIGFGNANPRDLIALKQSLSILPKLKIILKNTSSNNLTLLENNLILLTELYDLINSAVVQEPPFSVREGNFIKPSFSTELNELIHINQTINSWLIEYEAKLKQETNIKSLKVKFNKIFGYYLEIPKAQSNLIPNYFERKQTLVNSERYTTKELSEKENQVLHAKEKRIELEYNIFTDICKEINLYKEKINIVSGIVAQLDVYLSHAIISSNQNYSRPKINDSDNIYFKDLRHPIIENLVEFISNDCKLSFDKRTMIITGPNMSGKSCYMRSVCLAIILGHIGCFVPASESEIGFVDGVFTRVGASDDLIHGQSTFLVEMSEVSYILNNCTKNSFVILDEIGRGTSTFDGLSLAWAITEYLNNTIKSKTLVATHYHLLNRMEDLFSGIENYHVTAKEEGDTLLFFHKLMKGGINKSYGIQVARIANLPKEIIDKALLIQKDLEEDVFLKNK